MIPAPRYKVFGVNNFRKIPQVEIHLSEDEQFAIEVVGSVLPFKVNNYVIDELIDWDNIRTDPMFILTFPQKEMLSKDHFDKMATAILEGMSKSDLKAIANEIRYQLNPHPAGQQQMNVPEIDGIKLPGIQHKYDQTILFFPQHGQTCHAYCTFCFRWPQFVGIDELKFAMKETELMVKYLKAHPEVTDVLFTGGDPMIMKADRLRNYILPLLEADLPNLQTIRIGSKALGYWPYRFTHDKDADEVLDIFRKVSEAGKHLAFMAHFNSPAELKTEAVAQAVKAIRLTGAEIRTQSPIMRNINDSSEAWATMWKEQVRLGMIPYYMFLARDTGPQNYFAVPLIKTWKIFQKAYSQVSGVARTVRGPSMSAGPGKVHIIGPAVVAGEKVILLNFIQGRNPNWVNKPFTAKYDTRSIWLDDLVPAFGEDKFFFEEEYKELRKDSLTNVPQELVPSF
ncbi:MAG: lysine 2,3-aminomutase [Cyclobacteriaceae bacterium]